MNRAATVDHVWRLLSRACPQRDSNPCRRLERAVSWATRRWERRRLRSPWTASARRRDRPSIWEDTKNQQSGTFGLSALILLTGVRSRPAPGRPGTARASLWSLSADGVRIVFGSRLLLTLLLFGWLAGFYIVPEGLAAPYARSLHGNALTVGLLMARSEERRVGKECWYRWLESNGV